MFFVHNEYSKIRNILLHNNYCITHTEEATINQHKNTPTFYSYSTPNKTIIYTNGKYMKTNGENIFGHRTIEKSIKVTKFKFTKKCDDKKDVYGKFAQYTINLKPHIQISIFKVHLDEQMKGTLIMCQMQYVNLVKEMILDNFKEFVSEVHDEKYTSMFETVKIAKLIY